MPVLDFPSPHVDAETLSSVSIALAAGIDDSEQISAIANQHLAGLDLLYTIAVMCAPDQPDQIDRLYLALAADEFHQVIEVLNEMNIPSSVDGSTVLLFRDAEDPRQILKTLIENDWLGHIASGFMLRWIVANWQKKDASNDVSLAKAAKNFEEWCNKYGIRGGKSQNITKNIWKKYRCVSHLWASFYIMQEFDVEIGSPEGLLAFFSTARGILDSATTIVPKGRRLGETLISRSEAWEIPDGFVNWKTRGDTGERLAVHFAWPEDIAAHDIRNREPPPQQG